MGHLAPFTLLDKTPPGTCAECAVAHDPGQPHNAQSLAYQYKFYDQHGRWPDWRDAMAHCDDAVKAMWRDALIAKGVDVDDTGLRDLAANQYFAIRHAILALDRGDAASARNILATALTT